MDNENLGNKYTVYDEQRKHLEKLMNEPDKPVHIPSPVKERKPREPREFIRNIWGSSAGVGSGDFHIYRGIRRRQMEREEYMEKKSKTETLDNEYTEKQKSLNEKCEEKTTKKRLKRQKKKLNKNTKNELIGPKPGLDRKSNTDEEVFEKDDNVPQEALNKDTVSE